MTMSGQKGNIMIIGIDIDNVINNLASAVIKVYNEDSGDNLTLEDITDYYIEKFVKDNFKKDFLTYFIDKRVWKNISLIPDAVETVTKLHNEGHEIYFVTSTEPQNVIKKSGWLEKIFPMIDIRKRLIVCHRKTLLSGLDIMIDDYPKNLIGGDFKGILLDYPWNKNCYDSTIVRCKNWPEIYDAIKNYIIVQ